MACFSRTDMPALGVELSFDLLAWKTPFGTASGSWDSWSATPGDLGWSLHPVNGSWVGRSPDLLAVLTWSLFSLCYIRGS